MTRILGLNAFDANGAVPTDLSLRALLQQRSQLWGAASVLLYRQPLEVVRGEGCWLYAADGVRYLDAYNNVACVGHCHPHVLDAVTRQLSLLNINSRYLHRGTMNYARQLLDRLPSPLSNITFTCTGSEANDLALRLAFSFTGGQGVIVTEAAYHGNTQLVSQVSPSSHRQWQASPHVRVVPAPLLAPDAFAGHVAAAIDDLGRQGIRVAALLADSIFSSDGVCADPPGFLLAAVETVHRHGGLLVADEVQPGFGRTGACWWGFQRHQVMPDIVTMGKPMANGYPVGAVITRPEVLKSYCDEVGYFNTFAGSAVAAAAGQAVLEIIERENLMGNALDVGRHLFTGLRRLCERHPLLSAVRGAGLYLGVQVRSAQLASDIVNALRDRGVLISLCGLNADVLKIRPPLCFAKEDADLLLSALDETLSAIGSL